VSHPAVTDLLDPNTGSWDVTMVRDLFWEEDAKLILCLPVHEGMDDILAWHYNKNGLFSVKSAYKVCVDDFKRSKTRNGGVVFFLCQQQQ